MVTAFGAWFLVLIATFTALPARHAGVASQANPDDVLVIKAIIVDYISKEVVRFAKPECHWSLGWQPRRWPSVSPTRRQ